MIYKRLTPLPALGDIVESIWVQEDFSGTPRTPTRVLPTGTVEILFHYGDRFAHVNPSGTHVLPRSYVTGQRSRPVLALATGRVGIVIASLFPWGLGALFPGMTGEPDAYADLREVTTAIRVAGVEERLVEAKDIAARIRIVETFLMRERADAQVDARMVNASRALGRESGAGAVDRVADALSISRRHLARSFVQTTGIAPKTFARIMRFQRAIRLWRDDGMSWAAVAARCGYTDQAHLIHDVREFAGATPGALTPGTDRSNDPFNGGASDFFHTVYL